VRVWVIFHKCQGVALFALGSSIAGVVCELAAGSQHCVPLDCRRPDSPYAGEK